MANFLLICHFTYISNLKCEWVKNTCFFFFSPTTKLISPNSIFNIPDVAKAVLWTHKELMYNSYTLLICWKELACLTIGFTWTARHIGLNGPWVKAWIGVTGRLGLDGQGNMVASLHWSKEQHLQWCTAVERDEVMCSAVKWSSMQCSAMKCSAVQCRFPCMFCAIQGL